MYKLCVYCDTHTQHASVVPKNAVIQGNLERLAPTKSPKGVLALLHCLRSILKHSHGLLAELGTVLASGRGALCAVDHVIQLGPADNHF